MNVFRRAKKHLPDLGEEVEGEDNPYKRDILRMAAMLMGDHSVGEQVDALSKMGHLAYIGGAEASTCAATFLPQIMTLVTDDYTPHDLRIQALRTLSELCHRNRQTVEKIEENREFQTKLAVFIDDVTHIQENRWSCYLLTAIVAENAKIMNNFKEIPDFEQSLTLAAAHPLPWLGWDENMAERLVSLFAFKRIDTSF